MSRRRVVLVDDHDLFRAGVRSELGEAVDIVGEAASVTEAVPLATDVSMPSLSTRTTFSSDDVQESGTESGRAFELLTTAASGNSVPAGPTSVA